MPRTSLYALVVRCEATRAVARRYYQNAPAIGTVRARHLQTKAPAPPGTAPIAEVDEEELEELRVLAVGRRTRERADSVTEAMIQGETPTHPQPCSPFVLIAPIQAVLGGGCVYAADPRVVSIYQQSESTT